MYSLALIDSRYGTVHIDVERSGWFGCPAMASLAFLALCCCQGFLPPSTPSMSAKKNPKKIEQAVVQSSFITLGCEEKKKREAGLKALKAAVALARLRSERRSISTGTLNSDRRMATRFGKGLTARSASAPIPPVSPLPNMAANVTSLLCTLVELIGVRLQLACLRVLSTRNSTN